MRLVGYVACTKIYMNMKLEARPRSKLDKIGSTEDSVIRSNEHSKENSKFLDQMIDSHTKSAVTMRDLRFSRRSRFKSMSSGLWRRVTMRKDTDVSADDASNKDLRNDGILPQHYIGITTQNTSTHFIISWVRWSTNSFPYQRNNTEVCVNLLSCYTQPSEHTCPQFIFKFCSAAPPPYLPELPLGWWGGGLMLHRIIPLPHSGVVSRKF
jgi:hypothetical protein